MSENTPEEEKLSPEILIHLAESRSQLHDSFASNALTLLGIQVAVLPVSFAVASIVASPDVPSVLRGQILIWATVQVFAATALFATSVLLSFDVYRQAKQQQYVWLDSLRGVSYPELPAEEEDFDHLDGDTKRFAKLHRARSETIDDRISSITDGIALDYDPPPAQERLRRELGTSLSDEHQFRTELLASIVCTLLAAFFSVTGILTVVGRGLLAIVLMIVFMAVSLAYAAWVTMPMLAAFVHSPTGSVSNTLALLWTLASPGLRMICQSLPEYIRNRLSRLCHWAGRIIRPDRW